MQIDEMQKLMRKFASICHKTRLLLQVDAKFCEMKQIDANFWPLIGNQHAVVIQQF